jgi:hypothetical protein
VFDVNWPSVLDIAAFSHIWIGGWSFLVVRRWMYRVFEIIAIVSGIGVCVYMANYVRHVWRSRILGTRGSRIVTLSAMYLMMCAAVSYHSLVVFLVQHTSTGLGWYLYAVIVPETVLITIGLIALVGLKSAQRVYAAICVIAVALDIYTVHFLLMPYYSGAIRHKPAGGLETFHLQMLTTPGAIEQIFQRLAYNDAVDAPVLAGLWGAYLCATVALVAIALNVGWAGYKRNAGSS